MHWPVMSQADACTSQAYACMYSMHWPVMSQAAACTSQAYACMYCMHCPMMSQADAWQLLHGLSCFDFIFDIPLSPAALHVT
jgi:hypothetical protein